MFELGPHNAIPYLAARGCDTRGLRVTALGGGVSNTVLLAEAPDCRFVLKQSLGKLRVEQDWFSDRQRIFRESAAMRRLAPLLPAGSVPEILFEDRENCLFAMSAAPPGARTWKSLLLEGTAAPDIAARIARMLACMIRASQQDASWRNGFGDQTVFDQLRLDPYYRTTALRHPDLEPFFAGLIEGCRANCLALVHGDWSPKNFLVAGDAVMAIDFEVIHFGEPAFDTAFLLNHLLLKAFYQPRWAPQYAALAGSFWNTLRRELPSDGGRLETATVRHLGGLLLARIDGKSPAEYIREPALRDRIRLFARRLILDPPPSVTAVFDRLGAAL